MKVQSLNLDLKRDSVRVVIHGSAGRQVTIVAPVATPGNMTEGQLTDAAKASAIDVLEDAIAALQAE